MARFADGADHPPAQVGQAAYVVDYGEIGDVVEQGIDRKIPPPGILLGSAEQVVPQEHPLLALDLLGLTTRLCFLLPRCWPLLLGFRLVLGRGPKGGDLDNAVRKVQVGQAESATDQTAVAKQPLDLARCGVGDHIEILRFPAKEQVTDAPPHQIGGESVILEPVEDLQGVGIDEGA